MVQDSPTTVCVTGAAGFIGSWLVMRLLQRGYTVRATVRDPGNMKKVNHLIQLPKAETNLTLWKADLTQEGSFDEAIEGCHGVFHVATPMDFESKDPENEIIKPTIEGVLSIIRSCVKAKTVKKLVFTSSAGTVNVQEHQLPVYNELDWSDLDFIYSKKMTAWSIDVMDYSLLVGVDEENKELVMGIIDFMRQYTWDKQLETWVKASGILGGPKNAAPTIISPKQYKRRFRKAMTSYFLTVPDQWSS